jgi:hypothetical protein
MKTRNATNGMYLTNGSSIVKTVVLPDGADESVWKEISEEEAEARMSEDPADQATAEDYQAALRSMGVSL